MNVPEQQRDRERDTSWPHDRLDKSVCLVAALLATLAVASVPTPSRTRLLGTMGALLGNLATCSVHADSGGATIVVLATIRLFAGTNFPVRLGQLL